MRIGAYTKACLHEHHRTIAEPRAWHLASIVDLEIERRRALYRLSMASDESSRFELARKARQLEFKVQNLLSAEEQP